MPDKKIKVYLLDFRYMGLPEKAFIVDKLVNTTHYTIGQTLTELQVKDMCDLLANTDVIISRREPK